MGTRRQMTIGITINLDNYENIRFDVAGEVESDEDATELIAFLDGVLGGIGRDDEVTRERVDHYRSRVFGSLLRDGVPFDEQSGSVASCPVTVVNEYNEELIDRDLSGVDTPDPQISAPEYPFLEDLEAEGILEMDEPLSPEPDISHSEHKSTPECVIHDGIPPASSGEASGEDEIPSVEVKPKSATPFVCESCGAEVNKVQHDVSHLFMNKTLCKQCMNRS